MTRRRTALTGRCRAWCCSRNPKAARRLAEQFRQRQVRKVYWAVVDGEVSPDELPRDRVIALHGRGLTFLHPIRYEQITLTAPQPETWKEFVGE